MVRAKSVVNGADDAQAAAWREHVAAVAAYVKRNGAP